MNRVFMIALICCTPNILFAEGKEKPVSVDAEIGALLTSGNTESSAFKGKIDLKHELLDWRTNYIFDTLYKEDVLTRVDSDTDQEVKESQITAKKYFASFQADYKLDEEHRGLFVFASHKNDHFSGFEYQSSLAAGYSDRLFKTDNSYFNYSIGPGMSFVKTEDVRDEANNIVEGEEEKTAMVRLSGSYQYAFSDHAKFSQNISSDLAIDSDENTVVKSETALTTNINESFALKASYTVDYNSEAPDDKENADIQTALTLVYSF